MRYTAAVVQFEPRFGDKPRNLAELLRLTEEAALAGARLVVLPEMATTGYCFRSRAEIAPFVEPVPGGPTCQALAALAARRGIYVVIGLPEVDPATAFYYNTAVLIGPRGFAGKYRKLHSFIDETRWAKDGDLGIPVFPTEIGAIALQICMDADYFEPVRLAALRGADLIAFPTNWLGEQTVWYARARENGLYVLAANRWGEERGNRFAGNSAVIDHAGRALNLLSTGDGVCLAEVDLERSRAAKLWALAHRQPARYHELVLHTHLWSAEEAFQLPPGRQVAIAAGTAAPLSGTAATDTAAPLSAMADQARWADRQVRDRGLAGLDLMLFPSLNGPGSIAEPAMAAVAADLGCYVAWGGVDDGSDSAWLAGPEGLVGRYRAVHPAVGEPNGGDFAIYDLPWGRVGLAAGYDLSVPETARILSKRGADLIIAPLAAAAELEELLWRARWLENDTAIAVATPERSAICGARPKAVRGLGGITIGTVDTGSRRIRSKELLRKLQPFWYGPLVTERAD